MHRSAGFKRVLISSTVSSRFRRGAPCHRVCQHSHAVVRTSRIVFARSRASLAHRTLLQYSDLALPFDRTFCRRPRAHSVCCPITRAPPDVERRVLGHRASASKHPTIVTVSSSPWRRKCQTTRGAHNQYRPMSFSRVRSAGVAFPPWI